MNKRIYCLTHPAMAIFPESAYDAIVVHGIEYVNCESYLYISHICGEITTYHRVKVRDGSYGATFCVCGRTYKVADVLKIC